MKIKTETWFERFIDFIDPCQLHVGKRHGPCLASYGCRWTWFRKLYWGKDVDS